jgi:hypothetical protein
VGIVTIIKRLLMHKLKLVGGGGGYWNADELWNMMSLADAVGAYGRVGLRAIGLVEAARATRSSSARIWFCKPALEWIPH